jgi:hypothetical protein
MNIFYTNVTYNDGFGSQYQKIFQTYIFCKMNNLNFAYLPLNYVEHNYNNDKDFNNKLENLMNLKDNINICNDKIKVLTLDYMKTVMPFFENNIDKCCESEHMQFIKDCFWKNKDKNFFNNDKINVAIQIRRENPHDKDQAGERASTPNRYYLNIMNIIREKYKGNDKNLLFHIYSQGNITNFLDLNNSDVKFYINDNIIESFLGMVSADILVISPSSFSYVAALISDGEIYYKKFWHNPRKNWIVCG